MAVGVVVMPVDVDVSVEVVVVVGSEGVVVDAEDDVASVVAVVPVELESELERFEVSVDVEESGAVTTASDMLLVEYESAAGVETAAVESVGVEPVVEPVSAGGVSAAAGAVESAGLASAAAGAGVVAAGAAAGVAGGGAPKFGGSDPSLLSTVGGAAVAGSEVCVPLKAPVPEVAPEPVPTAGAAAAP